GRNDAQVELAVFALNEGIEAVVNANVEGSYFRDDVELLFAGNYSDSDQIEAGGIFFFQQEIDVDPGITRDADETNAGAGRAGVTHIQEYFRIPERVAIQEESYSQD